MSIEEQTNPADSITILADGTLQIREATIVLRDGAFDPAFAARYHRYVLHPGDSLAGRDVRVVAVADAVWTPDVVLAWQTRTDATSED